MIDGWFKDDLQRIYEQHNVAVFIDESGDAEFLLKTVEGKYTIYRVNSELLSEHGLESPRMTERRIELSKITAF